MKSWSSWIKYGWQSKVIKFGAINKFWIGKIMGGSWAGDEESRGPKVINSPMADAEAMTRIKECAEPPPPRLHLLPPWLPLLPPPSSIWQIHSPTPTSPPSLHLTFLPLFFSTFHTPSTLLRWQTYLLPLLSLQQVSHIHRRHRLLQVLQYEAQAQAGLCDTQRDSGGGCVPTGSRGSDGQSKQPKPKLAPTGVAVPLLRLSNQTLLCLLTSY